MVIYRGRAETDEQGKSPAPLTKKELGLFEDCGLQQGSFEDYLDTEEPPVRRFRVEYTI